MSASAGLLVGPTLSSSLPSENPLFTRPYRLRASSCVPKRKNCLAGGLSRDRRSFGTDCPSPRTFPVSRRVQVHCLKRFVCRRLKLAHSLSHFVSKLERLNRPIGAVLVDSESSSEEEISLSIGGGHLTSSEPIFAPARGPFFTSDTWQFGRPFSGQKIDRQLNCDRKSTNRMAGMKTRASTSALQELAHVRAPACPPGHVGLTPGDLVGGPYLDPYSSEDEAASPGWLDESTAVQEGRNGAVDSDSEIVGLVKERVQTEVLSDRELLERSLAGSTAEEVAPHFLKMRLGGEKESRVGLSQTGFKLSASSSHLEGIASRTDVGVPVFVMLPLDTVNAEGQVHNPRALSVAMQALRSAGVMGVMVDVWWGVVERKGPRVYDWTPYQEILKIMKKAGLQLQAVMSFHACGGNVGDDVRIPLPSWVLEVAESDPDIFYTDKAGHRNSECISLFSDKYPCLRGRTPLQVYTDFMIGFREAMGEDFGTVVTEVAIGMGPCGELRYPAYPEGDGRWRFPGVGEFQCYDRRALADLRRAAQLRGQPVWGYAGPHDSGHYNSRPQETGFFAPNHGSWDTPYGQFFLQWYSGALVAHGDRMLQVAQEAFYGQLPSQSGAQNGTEGHGSSVLGGGGGGRALKEEGWQVRVSLKCAGIHWWYCSVSHAAELTAGYNNTRGRNGYAAIIDLCKRYGADFNFTCVEMRNVEQPAEAHCGPQELLKQVRVYAAQMGVPFAGENALARLDDEAYDQMVSNACSTSVTLNEIDEWGNVKVVKHHVPIMEALTFLRLTPQLFEERNFGRFLAFVRRMKQGSDINKDRNNRSRHILHNPQHHYVNHAYDLTGRR